MQQQKKHDAATKEVVASKDNTSQITGAYYADMKRLINITSNNDTHSVNDTCILQNFDYKELNKIEGDNLNTQKHMDTHKRK